MFVIAAILLERNLQNVANYLIVSLAVADLMVACLVMPLGAVYVVSAFFYFFSRDRRHENGLFFPPARSIIFNGSAEIFIGKQLSFHWLLENLQFRYCTCVRGRLMLLNYGSLPTPYPASICEKPREKQPVIA